MARGDRRQDIVRDDEDRGRFVGTLEEVVERSGWVRFAQVLIGNHDHLLFKTPEANLVQVTPVSVMDAFRRDRQGERLLSGLFQ